MHYVKGHTHVAFNSNFGDFFNRLTFSLAHFGMIATINLGKKWLKIDAKLNRQEIRHILKYGKTAYTISPTLFPRPDYWNENLKVLGYFSKNKQTEWQADESTTAFIQKHPKILFVTFGSMINAAPRKKTEILLEILERHKIPAIINTASGGLVKPDSYNRELFHFVPKIPYDWAFTKVYAVIHHGGAGTTHQALKHGCATMIIPHIIDQFVWNNIIVEKGAGPKGVKIEKLKASKLEPLILDLMNNPTYKSNAEQIAAQMAQEDFSEELYRTIMD